MERSKKDKDILYILEKWNFGIKSSLWNFAKEVYDVAYNEGYNDCLKKEQMKQIENESFIFKDE